MFACLFLAMMGVMMMATPANAAPRATDRAVERAIVKQAATHDLAYGIQQVEFSGLDPKPSVVVASANCRPDSGRRHRFRCVVKYQYHDFTDAEGFDRVRLRAFVFKDIYRLRMNGYTYILDR